MSTDPDGVLCVGGRQHAFVVTEWEQSGAESFWALELFCATCGTTAFRQGDTGAWSWNPGTGS